MCLRVSVHVQRQPVQHAVRVTVRLFLYQELQRDRDVRVCRVHVIECSLSHNDDSLQL